jgi:hypothetical protein
VSSAFPWGELGITRTSEAATIRRAYADRLKAMDAELDADAFARLRSARDAALRQAKMSAPRPEPEPETTEASDTAYAVPWSAAAPAVAGTGEASPPGGAALPGLSIADPFSTPVLAGMPDNIKPVQRPDARLRGLLLGSGEDAAPLSEAEEEEARACLRAILVDAAAGNLARHNAAEAWLADLMMQSWPRCAPVLEEVVQAFGWGRLAGKLGESKAIAFLNARLAGYLFQRDVQLPDHPFHKAWSELSKPGRAGMKRYLRRRLYPLKRQVAGLLAQINKNYPEIESFLDPQRVASWEESLSAPRGRWLLHLRWPVIAIVIVTRIWLLSGDFAQESPSHNTRPAPDHLASVIPHKTIVEDKAVQDAFGPGKTLAWLRQHQPDLADWMDGLPFSTNAALATDSMIRETRWRAHIVSWNEGGRTLEAFMHTRAGLMTAALSSGQPGCKEFLQTGGLPASVHVPAPIRAEEQRLNAKLAETGKLSRQPEPGPTTAKVPGILMMKVMAMTGFSHDRVARALQAPAAEGDRCIVDAALIRATLSWHGPEKVPILRTL